MGIFSKGFGGSSKLNFQIVSDYFEKEEFDIALAILDNYAEKDPGNIDLIKFYTQEVELLIEKDKQQGRFSDMKVKTTWLQQFLRDSTKYVDIKNIPDLLEKSNLFSLTESTVTPKPKKENKSKVVSTVIDDLIKRTKNKENRNAALFSEFQNISQDYSVTKAQNEKIEQGIQVIQATMVFNDSTNKIELLLGEMKRLKDDSFNAQYLQQCESILRDLVFVLSQLEIEYKEKYYETRDKLISISNTTKDRLKKAKWVEFYSNYCETNSTELALSKKAKTASQKATPIMDAISSLTEILSITYVEQFGAVEYPDYIKEHQRLQRQYNKWNETRFDLYQKWAIEIIKKTFSSGKHHVKLISKNEDRIKIAKVLIQFLGEIDQTQLLPLNSRLYSECFEYFLSKLKVPKESQFTEKGSKLYVLVQMNNKKKKTVESF